ncbi:hypothetical protein QYF61_021568 [Mycteria americana]|uniref:Uncharacterized protein n=1 Tax=Mycteria americana TaxID=33587 RepID=A0AAN7RSG4_MYCAM|nr:hypothetical protein QYF61_021568 [Mycteria americana]
MLRYTQEERLLRESQNCIGWKRPLRSSGPTVNRTLPSPPLHHVPKHLIQTSFKYLQGWGLNHFPGQPVPMLDNPFSEEKFPNIQSKPPLVQLEAISSCPITCYLGEETDPTSLPPPFRLNNPSSLSRSPSALCSRPFPSFVALLWTCPSTSKPEVKLLWSGTTTPMKHLFQHQRPDVTERFKLIYLGRSLGSSWWPDPRLALPSPPLNHLPKHLIQTSFKYLQGWRLNHFPGQPVPMLDNPFSEEIFPNIQSKPPLEQLEAISSRPMAFVESDEVSPQPPFLQAEQPQVPQLLPISLVLQTLPQLRCPSLDTLQPLNVSLGVGGPKLNTGLEVRPHQCRVQGHDHCPSPAGHTIPDTSQDAIGLLGHLGTLLAHIQPAVNQHSPRSFSARQLSSHSAPSL